MRACTYVNMRRVCGHVYKCAHVIATYAHVSRLPQSAQNEVKIGRAIKCGQRRRRTEPRSAQGKCGMGHKLMIMQGWRKAAPPRICIYAGSFNVRTPDAPLIICELLFQIFWIPFLAFSLAPLRSALATPG